MSNPIDSKFSNLTRIIVYLLFVLSAITTLMGVLIMTDIGQVFGISKPWVVWYFKSGTFVILISFLALVTALVLARRYRLQSTKWAVILSVLWVAGILTSKYLTPYLLFRTKQDNAEYIAISQARGYLEDDQRVLVIDHNGVQRAYPPEYIWQAHIVGGDFGGDEILFTYCVITNLASPFHNEINGKPANFKVLAQTNSNLLIWDTESDEIIQQITQVCEFSKTKLDPIPVLEMTWRGFKKLYPNGTVLYNTWDNPIEKTMDLLYSTEESWYGDKWMFKTANFDDTRLPSKEHIIGIRDDEQGKELALTKSYIQKEGICNINVGNRSIAIAYFPEYETIAAFDRSQRGEEIHVKEIDVHGNTPEHGKLERIYIFNSVLWAIWAHYYPNSDVLQ